MSAIAWQRDARTLDGDIVLDGKSVDVMVGDGLVSFVEELSLVGSPIVRLGVLDPDRVMVESGLFTRDPDDDDRLERNVELELDGVVYWLRSVAKRRDRFELTFEDRTVSRMRERGGVRLANPTWTDHRAFVRRLCKLAGVEELVLEDLDDVEILKRGATSRGKRARALAAADDRRAQGIDADERLRVRSAWATPAQLDLATRLLMTARRLRASDEAMRALIAAAIEASSLRNETRAGADGGIGVLGAIPERTRSRAGRMLRPDTTDVELCAEAFLRDPGFAGQGGAMRADRVNPDWSVGQVAHHVRRAATAAAYDRWAAQARVIVTAFKGGDHDEESPRKNETLFVYRGETYWDAAVRIGEQNDFVFFVAANRAYYLPERTLRTSRPRMRIGEHTPGVQTIDWEWAPHKRLKRVELFCDVFGRDFQPGTIVTLDDDCGPAAGRWLIGRYERSRYSSTALVTLIRTKRRKRRGDR